MNKQSSRQCLVIRGSPGPPGEVRQVSVSVCRGRFAFRKTLFSIALFSLSALSTSLSTFDLSGSSCAAEGPRLRPV